MAKQSLINHPKTADLADRLDCDISDAVGLLECLFHFAGNYAPNGLLGRWSDRAIVEGMKSRRPVAQVIEALAGAGWILTAGEAAAAMGIECPGEPERWYLHGWHIHAQAWVREKLLDEGACFYFGHDPRRKEGRQPKGGAKLAARSSSVAGGVLTELAGEENLEKASRAALGSVPFSSAALRAALPLVDEPGAVEERRRRILQQCDDIRRRGGGN